MTKEAIKEQLRSFDRQFKRVMGYFESYNIIFNYINFLDSEPYIKKYYHHFLNV